MEMRNEQGCGVIRLRIRMKKCKINLQDYKGKPLKTGTVSAGRQKTEG